MNAPKRYPCGKRRPAVVTGLEDQRPVLLARCEMMGWPPTEANLFKARSQDFATPWGRLYMLGLADNRPDTITEHQKLAADHYGNLYTAHLRAIDAPMPHPKAPFTEYMPDILAGEPVSLIENWDDWCRKVRSRYEDATTLLKVEGMNVYEPVKRLCEDQADVKRRNLPYVRQGLDVLVVFFGIDRVRGEAGQLEGVR